MGPESSNDPDNDSDFFENSFNYSNYSSSFGAPMDDGVDSTELEFFAAHATSALGSSAVTRSTPAEDILPHSNNHPQAQCQQCDLNDIDGSESMKGLSNNLGSSFLPPNNSDRLGHSTIILSTKSGLLGAITITMIPDFWTWHVALTHLFSLTSPIKRHIPLMALLPKCRKLQCTTPLPRKPPLRDIFSLQG
jgi:hypothetical protein